MIIDQLNGDNEGIKRKINGLVQENQQLGDEVRNAQENLRLSANTISKLNGELSQYKERMSSNDNESAVLKTKIQKLLQENSGLGEEVRNAQENIRLSNAQQSKAFQELQEHKSRLDEINRENEAIKKKVSHLLSENQQLGDEVRNAQENLRLSANQISKLNNDLNQYKVQLSTNNEES